VDALAYVEELEARDRDLAEAIDALTALEAEVESIRGRASAVEQLLAELPLRRSELLDRETAARAGLDRRRQALADAHAELVEAERRGSDERIDAARRAVARGDDALTAGDARLKQLETELVALGEEAAAAERELPELSQRAARIAQSLRTAPRITEPVDPANDLLDWTSRARAALFLARTGLERELDEVVREAVELGTATLGEPVYGSTVEAVRRRLEERAS
jgi:chromosome segregation ATPase